MAGPKRTRPRCSRWARRPRAAFTGALCDYFSLFSGLQPIGDNRGSGPGIHSVRATFKLNKRVLFLCKKETPASTILIVFLATGLRDVPDGPAISSALNWSVEGWPRNFARLQEYLTPPTPPPSCGRGGAGHLPAPPLPLETCWLARTFAGDFPCRTPYWRRQLPLAVRVRAMQPRDRQAWLGPAPSYFGPWFGSGLRGSWGDSYRTKRRGCGLIGTAITHITPQG